MLNIIVYNNLAGKGNGEKTAREIADLFCRLGQKCELFSNDLEPQFQSYLETHNFEDEDVKIIVVGGDGTLSTIINAVKKTEKSYPIAIYPAGTANDMSNYLKLPKNKKKFVKYIVYNSPSFYDLINVDGTYAVHAVGSGNFTHSKENFNLKLKKKIGRFAYYFKCVQRAFRNKSEEIEIEVDGIKINERLSFFYVVNSSVVGGFKHFSPKTMPHDGQIEFIGFKPCKFVEFACLFIKMLFGRHLKSKKVLYVKGNSFTFTIDHNNSVFQYLDIDGNLLMKPPHLIKVEDDAIKFYSNEGDKTYVV